MGSPTDQTQHTTTTPPTTEPSSEDLDEKRQDLDALVSGLNTMTPARLVARDKQKQAAETHRRQIAWRTLQVQIGTRHGVCKISNFICDTDRQRGVQKQVTDFCADMVARTKRGDNVVFYGTTGTGKDHLLAAMMRVAVLQDGLSVHWVNGLDLFSASRDRMSNDGSEGAWLKTYTAPDILAISDPLPAKCPKDGLTAWQASLLQQIIDGRYRTLKPTWMTLNVKDGPDAEAKIGKPVIDRLRQGGMSLHFNWESYRTHKTE